VLLKLNTGVFTLHFVLMASFLALPQVLEAQLGVARSDHWKIYLPVVVLSLVGMAFLIKLADRHGRLRTALGISLLTLAAAQVLAGGSDGLPVFCLALLMYFTAFNYLEAAMPSLVSKTVYAGGKGTALGVYATFQFFGAFAGGAAGGLALQLGGVQAVLGICAGILLLWLPLALSLRPPADLSNLVVRLPPGTLAAEERLSSLSAAEGVADMLVMREEGTVYLKVDSSRFDPGLAGLDAAEPTAQIPAPGSGQTA
jgi:hypothetical protein